MADDDEEDYDEEEEGGEEDGEGESSGSKKKLFLIIGVALFLIIGGAAAAYFTDLLKPLIDMISGGGQDVQTEGEVVPETVFYDIPDLLVNLNTGGRKSVFLKIRISLELASAADIPKVEAMLPRVIDNFQVYLRELRVEDLKGSAGLYRLREELLTRVNAAAAPAKINDVLFKEMLVQ